MPIPTQMSLAGFIATAPQLNFTGNGAARFYARIGVEHFNTRPCRPRRWTSWPPANRS
jgi:hypothetical protein